MRKLLMTSVLSTGLVLGTVQPALAATYRTPEQEYKHHQHMKTLKRVGIGAAGGGVIGALAGGGTGAAIGAIAGGGTGALYDRHKRHHYPYH
jgi:hypothetical protein